MYLRLLLLAGAAFTAAAISTAVVLKLAGQHTGQNTGQNTGQHTGQLAGQPDLLACGEYSGIPESGTSPRPGMVWIENGRFAMGSEQVYPEEGPVHEVRVNGFWIDRHEVTNAQYARFVQQTGYRTLAERYKNEEEFADIPAEQRVPGSVVFVPVNGNDGHWWQFVADASWRQPEGPGSDIKQRMNHPVVHIAWEDARAYADWAGTELPSEAQREFAARGGLEGREYAWGDERDPDGQIMANYWQGEFPWQNTLADGHAGTAPVGCFPANGYGLHDMVGNVWEWTSDTFAPGHGATGSRGAETMRVIKGGSFLCAENYCRRYRPASRHPQDPTMGTSHLGFRTVANQP